MAYEPVTNGIIVTSKTNQLLVDFGDYATNLTLKKASYMRVAVNYFELKEDLSCVLAYVDGAGEFPLDMSGTSGMQVKNINGNVPSNNTELLDLLSEL